MTSAVSQRTFFVNRWVDAAAAGGLSIALYVALLALPGGGPAQLGIGATLGLFFCFNFPHFSATNWRLYRSWGNVRQFPVTALGLPVLMAAVIVAGLRHPGLVAPALIGLYYLWSPFHYSGQTLGITLLYGRRADFEVGRPERLALATFVYSAFVNAFVGIDRSLTDTIFYGIEYPRLGLPAWLGPATLLLAAAGGGLFLALVVRKSLARRRVPPLALLMPALAHLVWFIVAKRTNSPLFILLIPSFHSLQYLLIAWAVQMKEKQDETGEPPSPDFVWRQTLKWGGGNVAGGLLLFGVLPWLLIRTFHPGVSTEAGFGIVWAAINVHHFFVDGVIWKLRRPGVASSLMVTWSDFGRRAERRGLELLPVESAPMGSLR